MEEDGGESSLFSVSRLNDDDEDDDEEEEEDSTNEDEDEEEDEDDEYEDDEEEGIDVAWNEDGIGGMEGTR